MFQSPSNAVYWAIADYLGDIFYILDVVLIKPRLMYLNEDGIYIGEKKEMVKHYVKAGGFK